MSKSKSVIAYHFVGDTLRNGRLIPPTGKRWTYGGRIVICETGLHASRHPYDALQYAPGHNLCLVHCDGIVAEQDDKLVCRSRTILKRFDATPILRAYARWCALQVVHLWDAPKIVIDYLNTGDESKLAAARAATWDATWGARDAALAAAWAAAWATARDAARAAAHAACATAWAHDAASAAECAAARAAWDAQKEEFKRLVDAEFAKID